MIPAKIIEPAVGAWTWAFGNQICIKNNGSFAKNSKVNIVQISSSFFITFFFIDDSIPFDCFSI